MRMIRRTFVATAVAATAALSAGTAFAQGKEVKIGYALAVKVLNVPYQGALWIWSSASGKQIASIKGQVGDHFGTAVARIAKPTAQVSERPPP